MSVVLLILGLVLFIGLVVAHEWGHFIVARRNGVEIEEFGIFFPPTLYRHKTKGGWDFTINLLPLGGFVKLKGEHDSDTEKGTFGAATLAAKSKIMAAGVVVNLLIGLILLTAVALIGTPQIVPNQYTVKSDSHVVNPSVIKVEAAEKNSPAAKAGLKSKDIIIGLGPQGNVQHINTVTDLQQLTQKYAGQKVFVQYTRDKQTGEVATTLNTKAVVDASTKTDHPTGYLGVTFQDDSSGITTIRSTWSAPVVAVGLLGQFTVLTFQGLGHALAGLGGIIAGTATNNHAARVHGQTQASSEVGGPVAIFHVLKDGSALGIGFTLFIIGIVSLTLAIMNILPIPALDGGRLWLTLIMHGLKKPLTPKREEVINAAGFAVLLMLMVAITVVDLKRHY
jgi:regulator of sigma E protease